MYYFQAEFESEGLRSQKISYYDNKKTVDLLLNVSYADGIINSAKMILYHLISPTGFLQFWYLYIVYKY